MCFSWKQHQHTKMLLYIYGKVVFACCACVKIVEQGICDFDETEKNSTQALIKRCLKGLSQALSLQRTPLCVLLAMLSHNESMQSQMKCPRG